MQYTRNTLHRKSIVPMKPLLVGNFLQQPASIRMVSNSFATDQMHTLRDGDNLKAADKRDIPGIYVTVTKISKDGSENVVRRRKMDTALEAQDFLIAFVGNQKDGSLEREDSGMLSVMKKSGKAVVQLTAAGVFAISGGLCLGMFIEHVILKYV